MSNKIILGRLGEKIAEEFLKKKGYKIVARNFHGRGGEIDIIALNRGQFIFVEVKTRETNDFGAPIEAITPEKIRKIILTSKIYLLKNKKDLENFRLDAISVEMNSAKKQAKVRHYKSITNQ